MKLSLFSGLILLLMTAWSSLEASAADVRSPVVVELFTSEGCSSCPPADRFLAKVDQQPVPGAQLIVLSEHVDYWNHIGWKDPYSSHFYSERQDAYGRRFDLDSVYTPQMVVDGTAEFTGSDTERAAKAIAQALKSPKIPIRLSGLSVGPAQTLRVRVEADALPSSYPQREAELYVALALNRAESHVSGGENDGRTLSHVAVARSLVKVGVLKHDKNLAQDVTLNFGPAVDSHNLRVIAFVQETGQGRVLGAAEQLIAPQ
jgi:hypothetical protein